MPFKRKYGAKRGKGPKRYYRKKSGRRYGKSASRFGVKGKASTTIIKQPSGLADRTFVKLKYWETLNFTQTLGSLGVNVYRINSLFDPDLTGTGGQPYLFDQWSALYQSYRIHGCKITISAYTQVGGATSTMYSNRIGITFSSSSTSFGSSGQELIQEQPYTKSKQLKMGNADTGQAMVSAYMSCAKLEGRTKKGYNANPNFEALISANPSNSLFAHVWCYAPSGLLESLVMEVKLTYYAEFFDRARPGLS